MSAFSTKLPIAYEPKALAAPKQKLWLRVVKGIGRGVWGLTLWTFTTTKKPEPRPEPTRWVRPWVRTVVDELADPSPCACLRMIVWVFLVLALIALPFHLAIGG